LLRYTDDVGVICRCVLTVVIGIVTVIWYATGSSITEEEMEEDARRRIDDKERRGKFFGLFKRKA
jgi:iron transport multicopper oxidase